MFGVPKKTQDGRYYVKPNEKKFVQLNNVAVVSLSQDSITLSVGEAPAVADVDALVLASARENSELWFSRVVADKTLEAAYVKSASDGVMNVAKPAYHKVYRNRELESGDALCDGLSCDVVLELSGVSFTKKTFNPVWRLVQTRIKDAPKKKYHEEYLFQDDEPAEVSDDDLFA
jgi:hypothetical protein